MWIALTIAAVALTGARSTGTLPFASGQAAGSGSTVTLASTIEPWWAMIQQSFVSAAEAMPADKYDFAPKDGAFTNARTFAQQVKHVACANVSGSRRSQSGTHPITTVRS